MKKLLPLISAAFFCTIFSAKVKAQPLVTYGPEIGFTASGLVDTYTEEVWAGLLVHAGGTAHIQIGEYFAIRPSLQLQTGKMINGDYTSETISLTRLSVPVAVLFSKLFENENKMYFGAGPNLKFALGGKYNNGTRSEKLKFGNSADDFMKPIDLGVHLRSGFDFSNGVSLGLFLNYGITNLSPMGAPEKLIALDAVGFSFAWMFGGNRDY